MSPDSDIARLTSLVKAFVDERDWSQFHSPKNLAMALSGEAGELTAEFQWLTEDESRALAVDSHKRSQVVDEAADVAIYLLLLADALGMDLADAVERKLAANAQRYPAESVRGSAQKH